MVSFCTGYAILFSDFETQKRSCPIISLSKWLAVFEEEHFRTMTNPKDVALRLMGVRCGDCTHNRTKLGSGLGNFYCFQHSRVYVNIRPACKDFKRKDPDQ